MASRRRFASRSLVGASAGGDSSVYGELSNPSDLSSNVFRLADAISTRSRGGSVVGGDAEAAATDSTPSPAPQSPRQRSSPRRRYRPAAATGEDCNDVGDVDLDEISLTESSEERTDSDAESEEEDFDPYEYDDDDDDKELAGVPHTNEDDDEEVSQQPFLRRPSQRHAAIRFNRRNVAELIVNVRVVHRRIPAALRPKELWKPRLLRLHAPIESDASHRATLDVFRLKNAEGGSRKTNGHLQRIYLRSLDSIRRGTVSPHDALPFYIRRKSMVGAGHSQSLSPTTLAALAAKGLPPPPRSFTDPPKTLPKEFRYGQLLLTLSYVNRENTELHAMTQVEHHVHTATKHGGVDALRAAASSLSRPVGHQIQQGSGKLAAVARRVAKVVSSSSPKRSHAVEETSEQSPPLGSAVVDDLGGLDICFPGAATRDAWFDWFNDFIITNELGELRIDGDARLSLAETVRQRNVARVASMLNLTMSSPDRRDDPFGQESSLLIGTADDVSHRSLLDVSVDGSTADEDKPSSPTSNVRIPPRPTEEVQKYVEFFTSGQSSSSNNDGPKTDGGTSAPKLDKHGLRLPPYDGQVRLIRHGGKEEKRRISAKGPDELAVSGGITTRTERVSLATARICVESPWTRNFVIISNLNPSTPVTPAILRRLISNAKNGGGPQPGAAATAISPRTSLAREGSQPSSSRRSGGDILGATRTTGSFSSGRNSDSHSAVGSALQSLLPDDGSTRRAAEPTAQTTTTTTSDGSQGHEGAKVTEYRLAKMEEREALVSWLLEMREEMQDEYEVNLYKEAPATSDGERRTGEDWGSALIGSGGNRSPAESALTLRTRKSAATMRRRSKSSASSADLALTRSKEKEWAVSAHGFPRQPVGLGGSREYHGQALAPDGTPAPRRRLAPAGGSDLRSLMSDDSDDSDEDDEGSLPEFMMAYPLPAATTGAADQSTTSVTKTRSMMDHGQQAAETAVSPEAIANVFDAEERGAWSYVAYHVEGKEYLQGARYKLRFVFFRAATTEGTAALVKDAGEAQRSSSGRFVVLKTDLGGTPCIDAAGSDIVRIAPWARAARALGIQLTLRSGPTNHVVVTIIPPTAVEHHRLYEFARRRLRCPVDELQADGTWKTIANQTNGPDGEADDHGAPARNRGASRPPSTSFLLRGIDRVLGKGSTSQQRHGAEASRPSSVPRTRSRAGAFAVSRQPQQAPPANVLQARASLERFVINDALRETQVRQAPPSGAPCILCGAANGRLEPICSATGLFHDDAVVAAASATSTTNAPPAALDPATSAILFSALPPAGGAPVLLDGEEEEGAQLDKVLGHCKQLLTSSPPQPAAA